MSTLTGSPVFVFTSRNVARSVCTDKGLQMIDLKGKLEGTFSKAAALLFSQDALTDAVAAGKRWVGVDTGLMEKASAEGLKRRYSGVCNTTCKGLKGNDVEVVIKAKPDSGLLTKVEYYSTSSGLVELALTPEQVAGGFHSGDCEASITAVMENTNIKNQLEKLDNKLVFEEMQEIYFESESLTIDNAKMYLVFEACASLTDETGRSSQWVDWWIK